MGRGNGRTASQERIEDQVAGIREGFHEELGERARERGGMRSLAALCFHLDYVARAGNSAVASSRLFALRRVVCHESWFFPRSAAAPRGPVPSRPLPDVDVGLLGE